MVCLAANSVDFISHAEEKHRFLCFLACTQILPGERLMAGVCASLPFVLLYGFCLAKQKSLEDIPLTRKIKKRLIQTVVLFFCQMDSDINEYISTARNGPCETLLYYFLYGDSDSFLFYFNTVVELHCSILTL